MLTIDALKGFGADTSEGLTRCMGNEAFYLRLVKTVPEEPNFKRLSDAIAAGNMATAFEAAHALKGIVANLSLTPIYGPVSELTEKLRAKQKGDYSGLLKEVLAQKDKLGKICSD